MPLTPRFDEAFLYASELHRTQTRKSSDIPYLSHLMAVAGLVLEHGGDEETAIAGLLHDAVEDQGGEPRLLEIRAKFGDRIADLVDACTDAREGAGAIKPEWRPRKETYIARLKHHSPDALLVSCCDKLHNARTILIDVREKGLDAFEKFTGKIDGTLWYYRELCAVFVEHLPSPVSRELLRTVGEIERRVDEAMDF